MSDFRGMSIAQDTGAETCIVDDGSQEIDSQKPILRLRSLLIQSSLLPDCPNSSLDGSSSPASCLTTSSAETSLSISMSSDDSVSSLVPDDLPVEIDRSTDTMKHVNSSTKQDTDFVVLRFTYLLVILVIMLADGLQGELWMHHSATRCLNFVDGRPVNSHFL